MKVLAFGRVGLIMDLYFGINYKSGPEVQIPWGKCGVTEYETYQNWEFSIIWIGNILKCVLVAMEVVVMKCWGRSQNWENS